MRIAIVASILLACAGCGLGSHDVEVTVVAGAPVTDSMLATIKSLEVGASSGAHGGTMSYPLGRPMSRAERLVVHVTSDQGMLAIGVIAHDAAGGNVALGSGGLNLDGSGPQPLTITVSPPADASGDVVQVSPATYTLFPGQAVTLATVAPARWSVMEGDAGGTIDKNGRYTAPSTPGTYHVVASSSAFYGHSATVEIDVVASGVAPYVGTLGGAGFRNGAAGVGRLSWPQNLAVSSDGKTVYFTSTDKTVRAIDLASGTLSPIAGALDLPAPIDGTGASAHFSDPKGIVADGLGNLYVADTINGAIRKIVIATGAVSTFAGKLGMPGIVDGPPGTAQLSEPVGLAFDGAGTLYVADNNACAIRKIDIATQTVTTIAGSPPGMPPMCGSTDGTGLAARFSFPGDVVWDGAGHLYVADTTTQDVRKLDVASGAVTTAVKAIGTKLAWDGHSLWIVAGAVARLDADGTVTHVLDPNSRVASNLILRNTSGIAFTPDGRLLISDDETVYQLDPMTTARTIVAGVHSTTGNPSAFGDRAQTRLFGFNSFTVDKDGTVYAKAFDTFFKIDPTTGQTTKLWNDPSISACCAAMITDGNGTLYGTQFDNTVRRISLADGTSSLVGGVPNTIGYKNGIGAGALFNAPGAIALDGAGNAYVADSSNGVIRKIVLATNEVSLFAGMPQMFGFADGTGGSAQFGGFLRGLVYDGAGALYVADSGNNRIRKVTVPGAVVTTLSGNGMVGATDGPATMASFYDPNGLTLDPAKQNLYVADTLNNLVRKVGVADGSVTTVAGALGQAAVGPGPLPGTLNQPTMLRFAANGDLLVDCSREASIAQIRLP